MALSKVQLNIASENEKSIVKITKLKDKIRDLFSRQIKLTIIG